MIRRSSLLLFLVVIPALVVAPLAVWAADVTGLSDYPKPNAFDCYIKAAKQLNGAEKLGPVKPGTPASKVTLSLKDKGGLVKRNPEALRLIREGLVCQYLQPPDAELAKRDFPQGKFRLLARLLTFDGDVKAARDDLSGASGCYLDAVHLGVQMQSGSGVIGMLAGIVGQTGAVKALSKVAQRLEANQLRSAIDRFQLVRKAEPPYSEIVLTDSRYVLSQAPRWTELFKSGKQKEDSYDLGDVLAGLYLELNKDEILASFTAYAAVYAKGADQPYAKRESTIPQPEDVLSRILVKVYNKGWFARTMCAATRELELTALALRAYRLELGNYPESLDMLAPTYLSYLPDDPFGPAGAFHYQRVDSGYLLYSVGPDGKDDGGKPIENADKTTGNIPILPESIGDVVIESGKLKFW